MCVCVCVSAYVNATVTAVEVVVVVVVVVVVPFLKAVNMKTFYRNGVCLRTKLYRIVNEDKQ